MKHTQILVLLLGLITTTGLKAQQDNNWLFGRRAAMQFSTGKPIAATGSAMTTMEGSASVSDSNGNLLFYTDGITVWNKNNMVMPHGAGLLGDQSTTQSALIIPRPGSQSVYYIFTADDAGGANGLRYSEVNMAADQGRGDVTVANTPLATPVTEKISAVYHANGKDIWVTTHGWGNNTFYSFKITENGVQASPVMSTTGLVIDGADNSGRYAGWLSFSPDGKKLASASGLYALELFDFDAATGKVSNALVLKEPAKCYGVEFSANSKVLYATSDGSLLQYNLLAQDIAASEKKIANLEVASSIKLAPDSKIYVVSKYLSDKLSVINKPDVLGSGCKFKADAIDLAGNETFVGLPNFLTVPYYLLDIKANTDCYDTQVVFSTVGTQNADNVVWDFGDGNQQSGSMATHTYMANGTYTVNAKANKDGMVRYYTTQVTIMGQPIANIPSDMVTCSGESGMGTFMLHENDAQIIGDQPADALTISYHASQADADAGSGVLPDAYSTGTNGQTIYARLQNKNGSCFDTVSFKLFIAASPVLDMADSFSYCKGNFAIIEAPEGFDQYIWYANGKKVTGGRKLKVDSEAVYTLTVFKVNGMITCETEKTITVTESAPPVIKKLEVNEWTDRDNSITVIMEREGSYLYSLNGGEYQDSPVFNGLVAGNYEVTVTDNGGCGVDTAEAFILTYPKYFTPNGDGVHDVWQLDKAFFGPDMEVIIYDRYGRILDSFKGSGLGWNGTSNGAAVPASDYWFTVKCQGKKEYRGHFALLR